MSSKFSINLRLDPDEMLLQYPNIEYNIDTFAYGGMYGGIKIEIDGEALEKFNGTQCITEDHYVEEYLWFFYLDILESIIKLINKEDCVFGFVDSTNSIKLQYYNRYVLFTFSYGSDIKSNIVDMPILLNQYIAEVLRSSSEFIESLLNINQKVKESKEVKQLIEKYNEAEKAYQEYIRNQGKD
ncbi:MAG: hypothetical protein FIB08_00780 [Candidatus Methanoperedens sp.]|nr:hypothetical protein [Candidatus Methanoperedens sp.]